MSASAIPLRRSILSLFLIALVAIGLLWSLNSSARANDPPERTPTFSSTAGTATAKELVAAMDIPDDLVVSASLARASTVDQPVLNFPLGTTNRTWRLSQGAGIGTHTGNSFFALDLTDTVKENEEVRDLTGVEDVPILAAAGGTVVLVEKNVTCEQCIKDPDGNLVSWDGTIPLRHIRNN